MSMYKCMYPIQCHLYAHNNFWYISLDIRLSSCMKNTFRSIFHAQLGDVRNGGEVGEKGEYMGSALTENAEPSPRTCAQTACC